MGSVLDNKKFCKGRTLNQRKLEDVYTRLEASPKKTTVTSFGSTVWVGKMYRSHWYKVAKITALQNYGPTGSLDSRWGNKKTIL
jgi:hypothetical protein